MRYLSSVVRNELVQWQHVGLFAAKLNFVGQICEHLGDQYQRSLRARVGRICFFLETKLILRTIKNTKKRERNYLLLVMPYFWGKMRAGHCRNGS